MRATVAKRRSPLPFIQIARSNRAPRPTKDILKLRLLFATLVTMTILGAVSAVSGASAPDPYAQMKLVVADALSHSSVRVTATVNASGERISQVTDAGTAAGRQTIIVTKEGYRNAVVAELIAGQLYVKGDASILVTYLGLSRSVASQLANHWFAITKSSSYYGEVSQGLTIASGMAEVTMNKSVKAVAQVNLSGGNVNVLKGTSVKSALEPSYVETMYCSIATKPLPVEVSQMVQGTLGVLHFSHWNEKIVLVAPKTTLELK
jgi:hypothetical protein